ncbi:MAG TPA: hypothetical protein P5230_00300 [Candidatus Magasanikbacteria bacterium]|nr:hypothetical protein [Candidatus Magasanikbacteria bacterium]
MTSGGKRPYLDFKKYRYDEEKRPIFSFPKKPAIKQIKSFEAATPVESVNFIVGNNPFRKEPKKKINYKKFFFGFFIFFFLAAWFWLIFYLPYFDIENIYYSGIKTTNEATLKTYVYDNFIKSGKYWHRNNYFVTDAEEIVIGIKNNFDLSDVKVTKIFPDKLQIDVIEKSHSMVLCTQRGYYLLDSDGGVIKIFWEKEFTSTSIFTTGTVQNEVNGPTSTTSSMPVAEEIFKPTRQKIDKEYQNLPLFCIDEEKKLSLVNKNVVSEAFLKNIIDWHEALIKEGIGSPEYFLGQLNQWTGFEAYFKDKKWHLKLSPENIQSQIIKIKAVIESKESISQIKEYIDVRFGDRVTWK